MAEITTNEKPKINAFLPRALFWILIVIFVFLQLRLWTGDGSLEEVWRLQSEIEDLDMRITS